MFIQINQKGNNLRKIALSKEGLGRGSGYDTCHIETGSCRASLPDYSPAESGALFFLTQFLNAARPHTSLGGLTPNEFATRSRRDHNQNGLWS